jgi:hypothetical protein
MTGLSVLLPQPNIKTCNISSYSGTLAITNPTSFHPTHSKASSTYTSPTQAQESSAALSFPWQPPPTSWGSRKYRCSGWLLHCPPSWSVILQSLQEQMQKCGNTCKKRKTGWIGNGALHAETYEALEKDKAFFYVHSVADVDCENILSLEKSYFQFRQNSAKKQKTMYDFFC